MCVAHCETMQMNFVTSDKSISKAASANVLKVFVSFTESCCCLAELIGLYFLNRLYAVFV